MRRGPGRRMKRYRSAGLSHSPPPSCAILPVRRFPERNSRLGAAAFRCHRQIGFERPRFKPSRIHGQDSRRDRGPLDSHVIIRYVDVAILGRLLWRTDHAPSPPLISAKSFRFNTYRTATKQTTSSLAESTLTRNLGEGAPDGAFESAGDNQWKFPKLTPTPRRRALTVNRMARYNERLSEAVLEE